MGIREGGFKTFGNFIVLIFACGQSVAAKEKVSISRKSVVMEQGNPSSKDKKQKEEDKMAFK